MKKLINQPVLSVIFITSFFAIISSCGYQSTEETTTRGKIKIGADEAFRLLIDTEIHTFTNAYMGLCLFYLIIM